MGQKTNPIGFRLAVNHNWESKWFANKKDFAENLESDYRIREFLKKKLSDAGVARIVIERARGNKIRVTIHSSRSGVIFGKNGEEIQKLREELKKKFGKELLLDVKEIKSPDLVAQLVAENIATQLERRQPFRRVMKKAIQTTMSLGADGIRLRIAGRIGGAEIARVESSRQGRVPLHTLRENIDYGFAEANTVYGKLGIKCWICAHSDR
ncbi:MAG: 30S ribosomal protein S3 [Opitutales bacterium]|nr:30S ribosomal protein S3 [Opitutales bacterium]